MSHLNLSKILACVSLAAALSVPAFAADLPNVKTGTAPASVKKPAPVASRAAALKTKLSAFKDQKKAALAERVNTNLNTINANQTAQMQKHLGQMSTILDKLEKRVNQGAPDVKDPASAKAAIAKARAAIASASAAVTAQTQKDYTISVTSETRIKADAKTQRDKLHADLLLVRKQVVDAKQSVANAIRVAKSGKLEIPKAKEDTRSGK